MLVQLGHRLYMCGSACARAQGVRVREKGSEGGRKEESARVRAGPNELTHNRYLVRNKRVRPPQIPYANAAVFVRAHYEGRRLLSLHAH